MYLISISKEFGILPGDQCRLFYAPSITYPGRWDIGKSTALVLLKKFKTHLHLVQHI